MNNEIWKQALRLRTVQPAEYSPLTLAYLGDSVYELAIRTVLVNRRNQGVDRLNQEGSHLAKAGTQAKILHEIEPELTEQELAIYKRGRNAKSPTKAKNATMMDYRTATGFEALLGYLFLTEQEERLSQILERSFEIVQAIPKRHEESPAAVGEEESRILQDEDPADHEENLT